MRRGDKIEMTVLVRARKRCSWLRILSERSISTRPRKTASANRHRDPTAWLGM
jgi:hypothetical protein